MAKIRLHTDEQIARSVIRGLSARGLDVSTTPDVGLRGRSDREQLEHAWSQGRVLLTRDSDFLRLHAEGIPHAGVIYVVPGRGIGHVIRGVLVITEILDEDAMRGHLEFI